jgi:predicted DNA-binding transcriptional regulator YafY
MSQRASTTRQHLIINKLRRSKRATFEEIADYLSRESELDAGFYFSKRTFQRDVVEIESIYGIRIKYDFSGRYYFIDYELNPKYNERFFEAFDVYHALKVSERTKEHIYLENRQTQGTEHIYGLLNAIKNRFQTSFSYQKYYKEFRISLNIYLNYDFKMEILSFGKDVKVMEPKWFVEDVKKDLKATLTLYSLLGLCI